MLSAAYAKDGADPQWDNDPGMKKFFEFLAKYYPDANKLDGSVVYGYGVAQTLVQVLKQCGDDLTRENVMKQAASLKDFETDTLLPGIKINTSPTDFAPIEPAQDDALQGREVGPVRRHHLRRPEQLKLEFNIPRTADMRSARTVRLNDALRAHAAGGFLLPVIGRKVFNAGQGAAKCSHSNKNDTSTRSRETEMPAIRMRLGLLSAALTIALASTSAFAQKGKYDTGATDTEIKIGNIMPYSGPASSYSVIGKTEAAYFNKINAEGGINGRKINFISYDDGYSPPKTVEQARKLVESDEVLLIFNSLGTPPNSAIQKYMNSKKVPQLFVATGATKWNDPKDFPWTMGWQPNYQSEGADLRQVHPEEPSERQDRRALPERRLRQGLSEGLEGRARRQGGLDDRRRGELRDHRADHRLAHRQAEGERRRRVLQHHHAEIRGAGDQEERRDRMEAAALPQQRLGLDRQP